MKYSKIIIGLFSIILFLTNSCNSKTINGSGNIIKESRPASGFHKVSIKESGYLVISQGNSESLEIECDDNIAAHIRTIVKGGTLEIGPKNAILNPTEPIRYRLFLKNLDTLKISGSALAKGDILRTESLSVVISGSGKFSLKSLEALSTTFRINGSGAINIQSGNSKNQQLSIRGSGGFSVANHKSDNINITISGSGKATVWVTNKLDAKINGSGKLYYYGSPMVSSRISGSGKIEGLGSKK